MKALVMETYKEMTYKEVPNPKIKGPHDILVQLKASAICGSDVHGFDGSTGRRQPPVIMGHEAAGVIVEIGEAVTAFNVGDAVTFDSTIYCGTCRFCHSGEVNLCDNRRVLGVSCDEYRQDGTFAEYVVVPDHIVYRLPQGLSFVEAALAEPAAVAAHALRITPVHLNDTVAVVGTGLIGLLLIQILKTATSGTIVALDTDAERRKSALSFGADLALDPADTNLLHELENKTNSSSVDRVFEAVGATAPIKTALSIVRKGGSVTLIGNVSPTIELPLQQVVTRQITLYGSCAISGEYPVVLDLMARKKIDVMPLVSAKAPLQEGQAWFERLYAREPGLLKVVLEP
ncbi:zinc-dependent alcohol dehydrogenase [Pleomorphochaeta sp. DL1XJH-081]|uniref:zinc-dependent alcohol dehydrogenase n=1 Tax=Pleomorphochaeta sp. DL1XJH-081 TaxID=3409690 RepID=UPI003BB51801